MFKASSIDVEIDVFSGRPNPHFAVSGSEAATLLKRIRSLRKTAADIPIPGLGFRGFVLRYNSTSVRVFGDRIFIPMDGSRKIYLDTEAIGAAVSRGARQKGFEGILPRDPE